MTRFRATWRLRFAVLTLAAITGCAATYSLGRWQLGRAAQKQAVQAAMLKQKTLPALDGQALLAIENIANELHREVRLEGHWLAAHSVFLDNRPMDGRAGLVLVTPFQLQGRDGKGPVVLVQRGWVPRNFVDRQAVPAVPTPTGQVAVAGRIAPLPSKMLDLGGDGPATPQAQRIRQNLDLADFRRETGLPLLAASVLQTSASGAADGLLRNWPAATTGVDKHHGYAFQWFGLCALIATLYVWFQIVRPLRSARGSRA